MKKIKILLVICWAFFVEESSATNPVWTSVVPSGVTGTVWAFAVDSSNNKMYLGGAITSVNGTSVNNIAMHDGVNCTALGNGTNGYIYALACHNSIVYAGGTFSIAGAVMASNIAMWDGTVWSNMGNGLAGTVKAITFFQDTLYAVGKFSFLGIMNYALAKWDGNTWILYGAISPGGDIANCIAVNSVTNRIVIGGSFASIDGVTVNNIANFDGANFFALGPGVNNTVLSVGVNNGSIYIGGSFTYSGVMISNRIAKWSGFYFDDVGSGVNNNVFAIEFYKGEIYIGGQFTSSGQRVAKWNLNTGTSWNSVGSGFNQLVTTLTIFQGNLHAGGMFGSSGATSIIKWAKLTNPLPVELLSFSVKIENKNAVLNWTTASEINCDYFAVQKSSDSKNWVEIGKVSGKGTTNFVSEYNFSDKNPLSGISYYQLRQIDLNGESEYFGPLTVQYNPPVQSPYFDSYNQVLHNQNQEFVLSDINGKQIYSGNDLYDCRNLVTGIYFVIFPNQSLKFLKK
jgi:hypothetical protein